jgi:hypothetical protein
MWDWIGLFIIRLRSAENISSVTLTNWYSQHSIINDDEEIDSVLADLNVKE